MNEAGGHPEHPTGSSPLPSPGLPLEVFGARPDPLDPRVAARWMAILLGLGALARVMRYALRFPLWGDEAALAASLLNRDYLDLLRPLDAGQVCPPLFLWVQLSFVRLLGFTEYSLRLFPLLCGLAALLPFRHLAGRLLKGTAAVVTVGIFAAAYPAIRYSAEAKPYGTDLLVSLGLMTLCVEWLHQRKQLWLWLLVALTPLAILLSYPAVFVAGGVSVAAAWVLWRQGLRRGRVPWVALNLVLAAAFALQWKLTQGSVAPAALQNMQDYWKGSFPPLGSPLRLPGWLLAVHTGEMMSFPVGGKNGASVTTFFLCLAGIVLLCRRRQTALLALCLVPPALNLAAAALHRYPYGESVRLAMHLGPVICLLAGLGATGCLSWAAVRRPRGRGPVVVLLTLLALLPAGSAVRDLLWPQKSTNDRRARDFARWFWVARAFDGEVVCVKTDLGRNFQGPGALEGEEAIYLCNQRIYSPRHARGEPPAWDRLSASRPLRCVRFTVTGGPSDDAAFQRWLADMETRYRLVSRQPYPFPVFHGRHDPKVNYLEVFEFIPR